MRSKVFWKSMVSWEKCFLHQGIFWAIHSLLACPIPHLHHWISLGRPNMHLVLQRKWWSLLSWTHSFHLTSKTFRHWTILLTSYVFLWFNVMCYIDQTSINSSEVASALVNWANFTSFVALPVTYSGCPVKNSFDADPHCLKLPKIRALLGVQLHKDKPWYPAILLSYMPITESTKQLFFPIGSCLAQYICSYSCWLVTAF